MTQLLTDSFRLFIEQLDKLDSPASESESSALNLLGNLIYDLWRLIMCQSFMAHERTTPHILALRAQWLDSIAGQ